MNARLFKIVIKGLIRRKKEVLLVAVSVFFSFLFIMGVLLLQENMYRWQMASAKEHFGDWFVMSSTSSKSDIPKIQEHPYLEKGVSTKTGGHIYNSAWEELDLYVGTMSEDFMKQGNLTLDQGHMPTSDNEIVMY